MSVVHGKGFDWNLSNGQKVFVKFLFGSICALAWFLYSTPATINVGVHFSKNVTILGVAYSGVALGITGALIVSLSEIAFMYLSVWKSMLFMIGTIICGIVSIMGTVVFIDAGNQEQLNKKTNIHDQVNVVQRIEKAIDNDNNYIEKTVPELKNKHLIEFGYVKEYVNTRERQALERLERNNTRLEKETKQLKNMRQKTGAIITIGGESNQAGGIVFAIFIEIVLIASGLIAIGLQKTPAETENEDGFRLVAGENGLKVIHTNGSHIPVAIDDNVQFEGKKKIGFDIENVKKNDEIVNAKMTSLVNRKNDDLVNSSGLQKNTKTVDSLVNTKTVNENTETSVNVNRKNDVFIQKIKRKFRGKNDELILYIFDNFHDEFLTRFHDKFRYKKCTVGNIEKVLKIFKKNAAPSRTYIHKIVTKHRNKNAFSDN